MILIRFVLFFVALLLVLTSCSAVRPTPPTAELQQLRRDYADDFASSLRPYGQVKALLECGANIRPDERDGIGETFLIVPELPTRLFSPYQLESFTREQCTRWCLAHRFSTPSFDNSGAFQATSHRGNVKLAVRGICYVDHHFADHPSGTVIEFDAITYF